MFLWLLVVNGVLSTHYSKNQSRTILHAFAIPLSTVITTLHLMLRENYRYVTDIIAIVQAFALIDILSISISSTNGNHYLLLVVWYASHICYISVAM